MSRAIGRAHSSFWSGSASRTRRQATLAHRAGGRIMERTEGQPETGIGRQWQRRLAVELLVGIVLSIVLALVVGLAGGAMTVPAEPPAMRMIVPMVDEVPEDLDPRDPLVRCTTFETHTRCIREQS
jgi:hypothetical protein